MRVAPTRNIAAGGVARDRALAREQARAQLDLEIFDSRLLCLGEGADIVIGIADVVLQPRIDFAGGLLDLVPGENQVAGIAVKTFGVFAGGVIAIRLDIGKDVADGLFHIGRAVFATERCCLELGYTHRLILTFEFPVASRPSVIAIRSSSGECQHRLNKHIQRVDDRGMVRRGLCDQREFGAGDQLYRGISRRDVTGGGGQRFPRDDGRTGPLDVADSRKQRVLIRSVDRFASVTGQRPVEDPHLLQGGRAEDADRSAAPDLLRRLFNRNFDHIQERDRHRVSNDRSIEMRGVAGHGQRLSARTL